MKQDIDFVITWVDGNDPVWREKKERYTGREMSEGNTVCRFRDWETLKYWFRGVEKFAPWVRNVYFVTDDQKPDWLNLEHPKLKWIKHTDFIPREYLPTFHSKVIEWNMHRIEGLAEHFVYFNDDMFLIRDTYPEDFFVKGVPCDLPKIGVLYPATFFSHTVFNNTLLLNRHFSLRESIRRDWKKWFRHQNLKEILKILYYGRKPWLPGFTNRHIHTAYRKETFEKLWQVETQTIHSTCMDKLRTASNVSHWCVRGWQILSGQFFPQKPIGRAFGSDNMDGKNGIIQYLVNQKGKIICINDNEKEMDYEQHKRILIDAFETILPEKSLFEK